MQNKSPLRLSLCALVLMMLFGLAPSASASITVGPTIKIFTEKEGAAPGAVVKGKVIVTNGNNALQFIQLSVADVYYDEHNIPIVIEGGAEIPNKVSLRTWIKLNISEGPVTFKPNETKEISYEIRIPEDATPGSHMGAIYALGIADPRDKNGEALTVRTRMGAGVLVEIPGDIIKSGEVMSFDVGIGRGDARSASLDPQRFFGFPPINFDAAYKNTGNTFYQPGMRLELFNWWGRKVDEFVSRGLRVFPGNTLHFNGEITKGSWLWFGPYKAVLHTQDGDGNVMPDREVTFWFIPWLPILALLVLLIVLFWLGKKYTVYRREKLKKHIEQTIKESERPKDHS